MLWLSRRGASELDRLKAEMANITERSELLDTTCGIGLWQAILHEADALHPKSVWNWSPEFRRLVGYSSEADFPNTCQSWSDKLHPEDVETTFAAFAGHLSDKTGSVRYDVTYRLMTADGSYRWFRATGGCRHSADGATIRACGSLTDIHEQKMLAIQSEKEAAEDQFAISALAAGLEDLAKGDLTTKITGTFSPKAQPLKDSFNEAVARLGETMGAVAGASIDMRRGSDEISRAAHDLSRRTESQAASLEETAAALDEITVTVKRSAEGASQAAGSADAAKADAERSGAIVDDAVSAMGEIESSSRAITQIISVIDEIAFQTNLLALNAGVEAARAGESGRGFAVVASEVRALAQRSATAAKEIKSLISSSSTQVERGVRLVGETGKALIGIAAKVSEIADQISGIAQSAKEQATSLNEVNVAVNQMDHVTQQNAAMVEEATAAAMGLHSKADELATLVERFRIGPSSASVEAEPLPRGPVGNPVHAVQGRLAAAIGR